MKVYALVGKSGTGKSYQAVNLCRKRGIESLVDDGLFVYRDFVATGKSAKEMPTMVGAIKTALFTDDSHRNEVVAAIEEIAPATILILGTSDGMVTKIAARLDLPPISETIYIDEITTAAERRIADRQRHQQGKHVVPVPSAQLKRRFSGYFIAPIKMFRGWGAPKVEGESEKTVVRPSYSYLGEYIISDKVISDIVKAVAADLEGVQRVINVLAEKKNGLLRVMIIATFNLEEVVLDCAKRLQEKASYRIEEMTAFPVENLEIEVRAIEH